MRILVDQDGVLADIEAGFLKSWGEQYPNIKSFKPGVRKEFSFVRQFDKAHSSKVNKIVRSKGFFRSLPPIDGAIEAVKEMEKLNLDPYIVTSAGINLPFAPSDKYEWVSYYFGREFLRRFVLTADKSVVNGDYLIDDKMSLYNEGKAPWQHVIFDQSYNREDTTKKRVSWDNWRQVLGI